MFYLYKDHKQLINSLLCCFTLLVFPCLNLLFGFEIACKYRLFLKFTGVAVNTLLRNQI